MLRRRMLWQPQRGGKSLLSRPEWPINQAMRVADGKAPVTARLNFPPEDEIPFTRHLNLPQPPAIETLALRLGHSNSIAGDRTDLARPPANLGYGRWRLAATSAPLPAGDRST